MNHLKYLIAIACSFFAISCSKPETTSQQDSDGTHYYLGLGISSDNFENAVTPAFGGDTWNTTCTVSIDSQIAFEISEGGINHSLGSIEGMKDLEFEFTEEMSHTLYVALMSYDGSEWTTKWRQKLSIEGKTAALSIENGSMLK